MNSRAFLLIVAAGLSLSGCSASTLVVHRPGSHETARAGTTHSAKTLGIPPGHLPPPGKCRVWYPGRPPGHQPAPGSCAQLARNVPPGAWLISRDGAPGRVRVSEYDDGGRGRLVSVRVYSASDGRLLEDD